MFTELQCIDRLLDTENAQLTEEEFHQLTELTEAADFYTLAAHSIAPEIFRHLDN